MANTLFDKYGGFGSISKIVMAFYDKAVDSEVIGPFFEHTDMAQLIDHQTKFIAYLFGGPASYSNEQLKRVHDGHAIDQQSFDEMARLLRETLEEFGVESADVKAVMDQIEARSVYVVSKAAS